MRANTGRARLTSARITRGDQEKLSFLPVVRRTRANVRLLDKGSELASDKSRHDSRLFTSVAGGSERKANGGSERSMCVRTRARVCERER